MMLLIMQCNPTSNKFHTPPHCLYMLRVNKRGIICVMYEKRAIKSPIKSLDLVVCVYTDSVSVGDGDGDNDDDAW